MSKPVVGIVDDDSVICTILDYVIEKAGFAARAFLSAREFLSAYDSAAVECLVLGLNKW